MRHLLASPIQQHQLLEGFTTAPAAPVFDAELVSLAQRDGEVVQDFGAVCRAALNRDGAPAARLRAIVGLGFEGTVLKRSGSAYRPGRQSGWQKVKARHRATVTLRSLVPGRDGKTYAVCDLAGVASWR